MKNEKPQPDRLNEQTVRSAATAAIEALQLEVEVKSVQADDNQWRVQFTADYGDFSDTLHDQFGKENSAALVREKVKRHLLKQQQNKIRTGVRIRRGKQERRAESDNFAATALEAIAGIAKQTAGMTGDIISQAARLPQQALAAVAEATEPIKIAQPSPTSQQETAQPLTRVTVKAATTKAPPSRSGSARQTTAKKSRTTKKAANKRSAAKSPSKSSQKKAPAKKRAK